MRDAALGARDPDLLLLEAGLLGAAVSAGAGVAFGLFGPETASLVALQGLLAIPVFLVAENVVRRRRRERERRSAEEFERHLRELAGGRETRIK